MSSKEVFEIVNQLVYFEITEKDWIFIAFERQREMSRSFEGRPTDTKRRFGCRAISRGRIKISYYFLIAYEKAFAKLGCFLARKPLVGILFSLIVVIVSSLGFIRLHVEQPHCDSFIVKDSQSRQDFNQAVQFFPRLEALEEQIIMVPKHGVNILSVDCLKDAILVHQAVVNLSGYNELCFRQRFPKPKEKIMQEDCVISSPLELFGDDFEQLTNISSILVQEWRNSTFTLSTGQTFHSSFDQMLSNFRIKQETALADALQMIYFIRKSTNEEEDQKVRHFETSFESVVSSVNHHLKCASLSFRTRKTTNDALQSIVRPDERPLYLSALIMMLVVLTVIYFSSNAISCLTALMLLIVSILLPMICAAGIVSLVSISLFPTALFVPFLLLGKVTSNVVLLIKAWERQKDVPSLEQRVSGCATRAGFLVVLSAVYGTVLFGIGIKSSFDVILNFFLVVLLAFAIVSIASLFVTVTLFICFEKKLCVQPCGTRSPLCNILNLEHRLTLSSKLQHFVETLIQIMLSLGGKIFSLLFLVCIISIWCGLSAVPPDQRITTSETLYQNNNFKQFSEAQTTFFGNSTDVSVVFCDEEVDYTQDDVQQQMVNICLRLQEGSYSNGKSLCWMATFLEWSRHKNISCSNAKFYQCLEIFLSQPKNVVFRQDLQFEDNTLQLKIVASRVHLKMALRNRFKEDRELLEKMRKDLLKQTSLEAIPVSETFFHLDDLFFLERETFLVLVIATIVVFVFSLFSNFSFCIGIYLAITFDILILEAASIMEAWDIHLNHISFLSLFVTIVLSMNCSIMVAHSFTFSAKQKIRDRMIEALITAGWPVLVASLMAIAGSLLLGFIYPSLANIFSQLIPLVYTLGLIHALVIFPPTIVLLDECFVHFQSHSDFEVMFSQREKKEEGVQLQIQSGDIQQFKTKPKQQGIAIVGISCRFPGAQSKDQFWDLLEHGKCSIGTFPRNRKEEHGTFCHLYHPKRFVSGRLCAVNGSYLEEIKGFDNKFFGISSQEARGMDPQQRILLQVVYEAIEDAGMLLEDLQRCKTGVFVGTMNLEYGALITGPSNYNNIDQFSSTGITASILANRVSFCLNLTGPSIAIDTACSSSLTALKLACDNLYSEDCDIAIVCAPNIVLNHAMQMVSSMAGLLAPDGRCKSFDASGDGYGRGEGFAAVILKLSKAAASDKDDVYCEIIACSMNNDGQNAVPMTAPSAKLQAELSRLVLEQSGLNPKDVDYVEAHGTGTAIGDVVEVTSIADTYTSGTGKRVQKLRVGSVKSNLNHTESTSGLAGLIKVALMIKKKRLVPTVNVHVLNPKLKLEEKGLVVQQTSEPWNTEKDKPRIGAVNSFGYGGSNVHAILREVTSQVRCLAEENVENINYVLTLSAHSKEALMEMAQLYSTWLKDLVGDIDKSFLGNLCYSLNERRSQFPHRLALAFGSTDEAAKYLADFANDSAGWDDAVSYSEITTTDPKLVFMFGGQGSQWYAMGRQLLESEAVFKEAILTVNNLLKEFGETWSLIDELMAPVETSRIAENCISQPATFAVQYATAQLLMSWRIYPSAVIGHSLGEFAAACVAGIITVKEALQLVLTRATLQDNCPSNGGMAALGMSAENTTVLLADLTLSSTLDIAAINDAKSVTVSGDLESIEALGLYLSMNAKGTFWRVLGTKRAFHSSHMELIKHSFQAAMKHIKLKPQLSKIPMYSTVAGEIMPGHQFTSDYWWQNIRLSVQFYPAMKHLLQDGYKQIIEISTQPILAHYVKQIALQENLKDEGMPVILATLPRKRVAVNEQHKYFLQNTVCKLHTLGSPIDWKCVQKNRSTKFVRTLNYPWQENTFWYRERPPTTIISHLDVDKSTKKQTHPLLEQVKTTDMYSGLHCWETEIDLHRFPNLKDHALIQGGTVMPGAVYLEMAFAMVKETFVDVSSFELVDVKLLNLLTLPETQVRCLRLRLLKTNKIDVAQFHITSVQDDQSEIKLSTGNISVDLSRRQGKFYLEDEASTQVSEKINEMITNMKKMPMQRFKEITEKYGFNYGPTFSVIKEIWQCDNEGLCLIDVSESLPIQMETGSYLVHPSILDACLQSCFVPLDSSSGDDKSIVPVGFESVTLNDVPSTTRLYCHVKADATEFGRFDVALMSPSGRVLLTMNNFCVAELTSSPRELSFAELAYEVKWKEEELQERREIAPDVTCIVLKDSSDFTNTLVLRLQAAEVNVISIDLPNSGFFHTDVQEAIRTVFSGIPPSKLSSLGVINMWPVESTLQPDNASTIQQAQSLAFDSSVFLIKLLVEKQWHDSRLFLISKSTQFLKTCENSPNNSSIPWGSTVWGLRRTAALEEPNLRVTAVDLSNKTNLEEVDSLVDEILGVSTEDEVAFRNGKRFINRLVRAQLSPEQSTGVNRNANKGKSSLYLSAIPSSRKLCLREQSVSKSSPSEAAIDLFYCWTTSESLFDVSSPNGCVFVSGKVVDVPEQGKHPFKIGDEVCGVIPSGRVAHSVNIQASNTFVRPANLTKEQAVYIPACLAIASRALEIAASGEASQKVLIHDANRGPGPAAVVLASALGHRVFCTIPDTCQKTTKTTLLEIGAEDVMYYSASDLNGDVNDQFDAVVFFYSPFPNSLRKSFKNLKIGGAVVIVSAEVEGDVVIPANKNFKYQKEEISHILLSPLVFEKLSLESLEVLERKGVLQKLQEMPVDTLNLKTSIKISNQFLGKYLSRKHQTKPSSDISFVIHSFSSFEQGNHLHGIPVLPCGLDECGLKPNRTYLVAGGLSGFGFEVARWMAENGAKSIGLMSRSKPSDAKSQDVREIERKTGAKIYTFQVDISNQEQMSSFKEQLQFIPSVAGIVHSAMVLRDESIKDLEFGNFIEVMAPKINGTFLLHQLSLEMDLDFFVMFSSMASIVGNVGQASYSACNSFQDSFAQYRRHVLGLPGLAINWGPISGAGVMERESGIVKLLNLAGLGFINAKQGVKYMAKVLTEEPGRCQISLFDTDWTRFMKTNENLKKAPRLSIITSEINASDSQISSTDSLAQKIVLEEDEDKRAELVKEFVGISVAELSGISSPSETDMNKSLYSFGVDSTSALTLKMQLESSLQVSFEVFYFMQPDTTPLKMERDIVAKLRRQDPDTQPSNKKPQNGEIQTNEPVPSEITTETSSSATASESQIQVVPLHTPMGSAIKFFCIHPTHSYAMSLAPISTGFQGQDLVSFYALGFTDPTALSQDWGGIRQIATHYVKLIREEQRHGPYFLGGYSFGGCIAYEMASLLIEQEQRVEFLAMIDTLPWMQQSRTLNTRLGFMHEDGNVRRPQIEVQLENYLEKLAIDTLKMKADEYKQLREERTQDLIIDELQKRALNEGRTLFNLRALRESLQRDYSISKKAFQEWQPAKVRYQGALTYLKCQNTCFSPRLHPSDSAEEVWGQLVDGGATVLVCPGDHYSMSELPHAHVTGSILATALVFNYRMLYPELPKPTRTFTQRRAVEKICSGVNVFLHSKRGHKMPHFGELLFDSGTYKLKLMPKANEGQIKEKEKNKKIIDLKGLRMVQPGILVSSALKATERGRKRRVGAHPSGNLGQIVSVITSKRVYNLEFTDWSDLKAFYNMIEAVFAVTILSK